jgi:hypothetical protein
MTIIPQTDESAEGGLGWSLGEGRLRAAQFILLVRMIRKLKWRKRLFYAILIV